MIPQIKKILFATDLSENSVYAFYYAIHMAKRDEAKIVILHAIEPLPPMLITFEDFVFKVAKDRIKAVKERLQKFSQKVDARIGTSSVEFVSNTLVRMGDPVEEILKAVDEEGCDVIVLGTHGKGFLEQTFLGSVSSSVLLRTRKPVFLVPLPSENITNDLI
ncbi:MAG: universal stress protein [Thermodesulfobacteriota bacterium]|jgi:nucleotide-binding universal stress UspA family protein